MDDPSPEELAAIVAAVEVAWPKPAAFADPGFGAEDGKTRTWRFSGRWWSRPSPVRRQRPWVERPD